jgi:hypothetical protein
MSGDWIKVEVNLPDKPEVWQIAGILGIDSDAVVGKLIRIWRWFDQHTENGNAAGVTFALLDRHAGVTGFAEAMALSGWLIEKDRNLILPNFDRHNGKTAKNRALTAKRVAAHKEKTNANGNDEVTIDALPREEKRREEKKKEKAKAPASPALFDLRPDWVPLESWDGFVEMRKKTRHELTPRACKLVLNELERLRAGGHEPGAVLDQSTRNGWRDVFPLRSDAKPQPNGAYKPMPGEI